MKYLFCSLCFLLPFGLKAQPLRDINHNYLYNPQEPFSFTTSVVRQSGNISLFFKLQARDATYPTDSYTIEWESRENLIDKESIALTPEILSEKKDQMRYTGRLEFTINNAPRILVAKVVNTKLKRVWLFYTTFEADYPVNAFLTLDGEVKPEPFVNITDYVTLHGSSQNVVSFYNDNFPAALPPFTESQGRVAKAMKADSTFFIPSGEKIIFSTKGLYLIQQDTNAAEGLAIRAEDDYPKLAKIPSLAGPMLYICTRQEYDRLSSAKADKKVFDKVILSITNDTERARKLIRNYFRRVELANLYFTSYKEGWKTDRGMIYIVFGLPDEVFKFQDREVWSYKNDDFKVTFSFTKSSSVFDPENYVLIREKKYQQTWYEVIDLWRNARF